MPSAFTTPVMSMFSARSATLKRLVVVFAGVWSAIALSSTTSFGQTAATQLMSRDELSAAISKAEQSGNPMQAAAIRARLTDGDFQVGDRIILTYFSDVTHNDTLLVRAGRVVDLPTKTVLSLQGVLRSELKDRLTSELLKYVKAEDVSVTPLTRLGVLGEVSHPGYFAVRPDIALTDAIMLAGGPTAAADLDRSVVKRGTSEYRSASAIRQAMAKGLTVDQFGLSGGDEIVVGKQPTFTMVGRLLGLAASIAAIYVAVHSAHD